MRMIAQAPPDWQANIPAAGSIMDVAATGERGAPS